MISNKGIKGKVERFVDNFHIFVASRMLIYRTVIILSIFSEKLSNGKLRKKSIINSQQDKTRDVQLIEESNISLSN